MEGGRGSWWHGGSGTQCRIVVRSVGSAGATKSPPEDETVGRSHPAGRDEGRAADQCRLPKSSVQHTSVMIYASWFWFHSLHSPYRGAPHTTRRFSVRSTLSRRWLRRERENLFWTFVADRL